MVYTRRPDPLHYPAGSARSLHLALSADGRHYEALYNNYGILFAEGKINEDNTIHPLGLARPRVFRSTAGEYVIAAEVTEEDGSKAAEGYPRKAFWKTTDWMHFDPCANASCDDDLCVGVAQDPIQKGEEREDLIPVSVPSTVCVKDAAESVVLPIDEACAVKLPLFWDPIESVRASVPPQLQADELDTIKAKVIYTDGSIDLKPVSWDPDTLQRIREMQRTGRKGESISLKGQVVQRHYPFPVAVGYGDPVIFPWEGRWYYISTNDNRNDVGFYVREADLPEKLFEKDTEAHLILGYNEEKGWVQTFWAPEFHVIGGELYILFAISGKQWGPNCHMMRLKKGGSILDPDSWEEPVPVLLKDGHYLAWKEKTISLDMTYFEAQERSYLAWSYRENIGTPLDSGSMLYLAETDPKEPWKLISDPVLLSRPLYGWENVSGTINNEGPNAFIYGGKVYLAYSGGAADSYTYAVGLLTIDCDDPDILDVTHWKKSQTSVLNFTSVPGEYGPGHNSFFVDQDGHLMVAYHAENTYESHIRSDGIRRVHFNAFGDPVFTMSEERDLTPECREVETTVIW